MLIGTGVLILRDAKILLGLRTGKHGNGCWSAPGGKVEIGEKVRDSAKRDVLEEVNLTVTDMEPLCVSYDLHDLGDEAIITIGFVATQYSGEVVNNEPDKFAEWNWFDPHNLPSPIFKPTKSLLFAFWGSDSKELPHEELIIDPACMRGF